MPRFFLPLRRLGEHSLEKWEDVEYEDLSLRPVGSDPGVVCQKNYFLKVSVSLGGFGPSVAHGKHSVRRRCVQATKNKAETCSLLDAIGRRSCGRWRDWVSRAPTCHAHASYLCVSMERLLDARRGTKARSMAWNLSWSFLFWIKFRTDFVDIISPVSLSD